MTSEEKQAALDKVLSSASYANYPAIFDGFMERGFSPEDIRPRENIFTYRAWQAQGRQVKRGEKGVRISSWIPMNKKGDEKSKTMRHRIVSVFHVDQTEEQHL